MEFVKRKGSTSAKPPVAEFEKQEEQYLSDIHAEVIMNDIPSSLIINWDHTAIHLVPVSGWTMNMQGEKSILIAGLDDKREVMVVLAVTLAAEYISPSPDSLARENREVPPNNQASTCVGCVAL